ncbi:MAG: FAD-dependent oxidoreductase [Nitrososphaeria archaeon]
MPFPLQTKDFEIIVVGGGFAGVCAAIAAARKGAKTALIEARPVLGGNASSLIQVKSTGAASFSNWARETGIIEEILTEHQKRTHFFFRNALISSQLDLVLYEWVKKEKNLTLYLNTVLYDVEMSSDNKIKAIECIQVGSEKRYKFYADFFIDCTGDGTLAWLACAEFRMGRESWKEFNEDPMILPEEPDYNVQGSSMMFRSIKVNKPIKYIPPEWAEKFPTDDLLYSREHKKFPLPNGEMTYYGWWWIEVGSPYNTITQNEEIRDILLSNILGVWDHIKNYCAPSDSENYTIDWIGMIPGKRESRRIIGDYIMTQHDVMQDKLFYDRIAYGGWYIDVHTMGGIKAKTLPPERLTESMDFSDKLCVEPYSIPFRCIYSKNITNLFTAGRNISATHLALGSLRVMQTGAIIGQAAGTAAFLCKKLNLTPKELSNSETHIKLLQQILLKDDCFIPDVKNEDPEDLALGAKVLASSEAKLLLEPSVEEASLEVDRCQVFPLVTDHIDTVSLYVRSDSSQEETIAIDFMPIRSIWSLNEPSHTIAQAIVNIPAKHDGWVRFPLKATVKPKKLYRINIYAKEKLYLRRAKPLPGVVAGWKKPEWKKYRHESLGAAYALPHFNFAYAMIIDPPQYPFSPENVTNGYSRPYTWTNIWISDPNQTLPQWLEINFGKEVKFNTVYLTFDTNLNIEFKALPPFYIFPECVKDYTLKIPEDGTYRTIVDIKGNYFRRRVHKFDQVKADKLRIEIYKTNGDPSARIYEIRVYNEE